MSSTMKKIVLKSSNGESFEVDEAVAPQSLIIRHMIKDSSADNGILLLKLNVTSKILSKVIEYCKKHVENPNSDDAAVMTFDTEFVNVDLATLSGLVMAAEYLNIQSLLDLTCQAVADMFEGKDPVEICKIWGIEISQKEAPSTRGPK